MYGIVYSICTNGGILCAVRCVVVDVGAAFCVVVDAAWCTANGKRHVLAKHRRPSLRLSSVRRPPSPGRPQSPRCQSDNTLEYCCSLNACSCLAYGGERAQEMDGEKEEKKRRTMKEI